ncbi:MAG: phBC6A51 family helix-turn-helix protein [bacterium]
MNQVDPMIPIRRRIKDDQALLIAQLKKAPIVQIACEKTGIARSTYYRWRNNSKSFTKEADKSIAGGVALVNDMAESQLLSAIKDRNISAIFYWLNHRHPSYGNKVEVTAHVKDESLSKDQQKLIRQALRHAALITEGNHNDKNSTQ